MLIRKSSIWIILIVVVLLMVQSKYSRHQPPVTLTHNTLEENTWVPVHEGNRQQVQDHHFREMVFVSNGQFEIRETFKFSGSTFKNPGTYELTDSLIQLKSSHGRVIGTLRVHHGNQLRVEWKEPGGVHGRGTEIFQAKETDLREETKIFSSRVFRLFN